MQYRIALLIAEKNQIIKSPTLIRANKIKKIPLVINCILENTRLQAQKALLDYTKIGDFGIGGECGAFQSK